jgi:hypothetical protein
MEKACTDIVAAAYAAILSIAEKSVKFDLRARSNFLWNPMGMWWRQRRGVLGGARSETREAVLRSATFSAPEELYAARACVPAS